jgi:predicted flap endonuclease-1-like 5' DNA nuclease
MKAVLIASLFCMDNFLPILIGLLGAGLLGWLLRSFLKGGGGNSDLQSKYDRLAADFHEERERYNKLFNDSKKKKSKEASATTSFAAVAPNTAEIDSLNNKLKAVRTELKDAQDAAANLQSEVATAKAKASQATTLNSEVETLKSRIDGLTRALDNSKEEADRFKSDFESANSERARLSAQLAASDLGAAKKQVEKLERDVQASRLTAAQLQAENDRLKSGPKTVTSGVEVKTIGSNTAELKERISELQKELNDEKSIADKLRKESETVKLAITAAVNEANGKSNQDISDLRRQLKLAEADVIRTREENTRFAMQAGASAVAVKQAEAPAPPVVEKPVHVQEVAATEITEVVAPVAAVAPDKVDDLKVIEGIGPVIEKTLNAAGVYTYVSLATMQSAEVKTILEESGNKLNNPETWPEQAALLRDGKMEEFKKRITAEQKAAKIAAAEAAAVEPDDLKVIEGIGPVLEILLNDANVKTYKQLASMDPQEIKSILEAAGNKLNDPATWPEQAALLRDGKMEEFEKLTEELKGGRRVD